MQTKDTTTLKNVRISELAADELIPPAYKLIVKSMLEAKPASSGFVMVSSKVGTEFFENNSLPFGELANFRPIITSVTDEGVFADIEIPTSVFDVLQKAGYEYAFRLQYYPPAGLSLRSKIPMMFDGEGSLSVTLEV